MSATTPLPSTHDVVVVGARCAGAATARLLAEAGHDVLMVERAVFPADTLSTHSIARGGVVQLARWRLLDAVLASGAPPLREIVFQAGADVVHRRLKPRHGVDALVAPRRYVLDQLLADAAVAAGAILREGVTVEGLSRDATGRVTGVTGRSTTGRVEARGRIVIGADGLRSRVAREVGSQILQAGPSTGATHYAYFAGDWPAMEYHLGDRVFGGVFPTHGGEACIWVCTPADVAIRARHDADTVDDAFEALLRGGLPTLVDRLRGTERVSAARGVVALPNQVRQSTGPGWALVGDAGYHRDPITGQGISDAFRDADLLAEAIDAVLEGADERTTLSSFEHQRAPLIQPVFDLTCEMGQFPPPDRFRALQMRLGELVEDESAFLAARTTAPQSSAA